MKRIKIFFRDFFRIILTGGLYQVDTRFRGRQIDLTPFITKRFDDGSVEVLLNGLYKFRVWDFRPWLRRYRLLTKVERIDLMDFLD